jgi:hypothetical protein
VELGAFLSNYAGLGFFLENIVVHCSDTLNDFIVVGLYEESSYLLHPGVSGG